MTKSNEQLNLFLSDLVSDEQKNKIYSSITKPLPNPSGNHFSDFIVFVDESGDHGLRKIDEQYPLFILAFCIFYKKHYSHCVVPKLEDFKFQHFGHDQVILHEHDIRKEKGVFRFEGRKHKEQFMFELGGLIQESNFILISSVIDKRIFHYNSNSAPNPYHIALGYCLESLYSFLEEKKQQDKKTFVVFESRGAQEDKDLELEFRRYCAGNSKSEKIFPFEVVFSDKKAMSSGLQLADLVARPIGLSVLRPEQKNQAFDILKGKFYCAGGRDRVGSGYEGMGLKIYPVLESEKPQ